MIKKNFKLMRMLLLAALLCFIAPTVIYADEAEETTTEETQTQEENTEETSSDDTDTEDTDTNGESETTDPVLTGWQTIDGYTYYYDKNGNYLTGVNKISGYYYYFNASGIMRTGWRTYKGDTYYFSKSSSAYGRALTGLRKITGSYYYFNKEGIMCTGWKKISGSKYFFHTKGEEKGAASTGLTKVGKKIYLFDKTGRLQDYTADSMDKKAYNMSSDTAYLILVSRNAHTVAIYKGSSKHWTRIKTFTCTVGASNTPTVTGTYKMGTTSNKAFKMLYFDADGGYRCWYASRITGGYLFHSVLYWPTNAPTSSAIANGRLGANLSHGCVRLALSDAKYIYKHIPYKTTCKIY